MIVSQANCRSATLFEPTGSPQSQRLLALHELRHALQLLTCTLANQARSARIQITSHTAETIDNDEIILFSSSECSGLE